MHGLGASSNLKKLHFHSECVEVIYDTLETLFSCNKTLVTFKSVAFRRTFLLFYTLPPSPASTFDMITVSLLVKCVLQANNH